MLRSGGEPLFAIVRMRKRGDWVLPKGKLEQGETPRAAAEREAIEETGHLVTVHEFLGTLAYEVGGRAKVVHFWRMEAEAAPSRPLMKDIRAVEWLPLREATLRLTRGYEQAFLSEVGPLVLGAAAGTTPQPSVRSPERPSSPALPPAPADDETITDLDDAPSLALALEQPSEATEAEAPSLMARLRRWLRGSRQR
ncbi:NUDIX hydrolase [Rhodopseudomonas sp. AAP120]|nr:NUDIX hydrolase [Rhodopseudomonas sp. AAP120]